MKIIHLVDHVRNSGNGIVNVVVDLAIEQRRAGNDVIVVSGGGHYEDLLSRHQVTHFYLPQKKKDLISAVSKLRALARSQNVDVIHAHMMKGGIIARLAVLLTKIRVVTTVHNSFQKSAIFMNAGHLVIAVSDAVRTDMCSRGIPAAKLRTVKNGTIGSCRVELDQQEGIPLNTRPAILTVAGLYERKGIADIIQAAKILKNHGASLTFYIAGEGPERSRFESLVVENDVASMVVFLGFRSDVRRLLKDSDVFILASHADPCPLVLAEARDAGLPIIGTNVDGIPESLDFGKAGLLIPPHDPHKIALAVEQLLGDKSLRDSLIQGAQNNLDSMRTKRVSDETLAVYREAIGCSS